jgi:hypothetical protein
VECWHEKRKTDYPTKNVESIFFENAHQASAFLIFPLKYAIKNKKFNEIICGLNTGFFKPIIPGFQHSIIPIVSEAN